MRDDGTSSTDEAKGAVGSNSKISSVDRTLDIVELLAAETTLGVTEVSDELGIAKSTVHDHLTTLRDRGYIHKREDGYQLGMGFLHIGETARSRMSAYDLAREKVVTLAQRTNERSQFVVEENGRGIYVHREVGSDAVHTDSRIGGHLPLYATAAGKALLSHYDDETVREMVGPTLEPITENTITDVDELLAALEEVRERGYATNCSENTKGLRAIGAPVELPNGELLGAISVAGPTNRLKGERFTRELPDLVLGIVNELELNIAYSGSGSRNTR
ncbi:IclR family transcriptional regulator (plasmid) [Haloarcula sp. JP-L23]|nr:IclR family transcriptional regulator [Haloarcula sp. JP-L23]